MASLVRLPAAVRRAVDPFLADDSPRAAVFDADGTLWRGDVGEDFLRYLAANRKLPMAPPHVYARYEALCQQSPLTAYGFAVEVMEAVSERALSEECRTFFARRYDGRVFHYVRPLFALLRSRGVSLWICSASPRWIVEAAAQRLQIDPSQVLAVDTEVREGKLTRNLKLPVCAGEGKVTWLDRRGVKFGFAAGNGDLDLPMLERATHRLVISSFDGPENDLVRCAKARGWSIFCA